MKKKYVVPRAELILFETDKEIMDEWGTSGKGDFSEDLWNAVHPGYSTNGAGNTVVNNNGTPTVIPGGNGGGRQTPLG